MSVTPRHDYTIGTLDMLKACDACADMGGRSPFSRLSHPNSYPNITLTLILTLTNLNPNPS